MRLIPRLQLIARRYRRRSTSASRSARRSRLSTLVERLETRNLLATFLVNSTADGLDVNPGDGACDDGSGACTLRGAIIEANALPGPDMITLPAGSYMLTLAGTAEDFAASGDLDITDNLTITGAGAASTIVDAAGLDRVFHIPQVFSPTPVSAVTLDGLTIKGGLASDAGGPGTSFFASAGGGILNEIFGNSITLSNSIVTDNTVLGSTVLPFSDAQGGGIADVGGNWTIIGSQIVNNDAVAVASPFGPGTGRGGGIYAEFTTTNLLIDTTISNNLAVGSADDGFVGAGAGQGGGIFGNGGTWTMAGSTTVDSNQARGGLGIASPGGAGEGGGIYSQGSAWNFTLSPGSTISRNAAIGGDGGFAGGTAAGGGIYSIFDSWFDPDPNKCTDPLNLLTCAPIANNTISTNTATGGSADPGAGIGGSATGGGIFSLGANILAEHLTIAENDATGGSGAFAGAGDGGGIYNAGSTVSLKSTIVADNTSSASNPDLFGAFVSADYNMVGDVGMATGFGLPGDQVGGGLNPVIDPLLGPLQNNGGPTETHELLSGSPAIDAADPSSPVLTDQRGVGRPVDGDLDTTVVNDVGAYEAAAPAAGAEIAIETLTNGVDADAPTGPLIGVGGTANFTYVVTNPGGVALSNVVVMDSQGAVLTFAGGDGNSNSLLDPGETWTYSGSTTVTAGQYMNTGTVTADDPSSMPVTDMDDSHHFGVQLGIDIEKSTNGDDADTPTGPQILVGGTANFTYTVTNIGNVALENIAVSDSEGVSVTYQSGDVDMDNELDVTETWIYTGSTTVTAGQYANTGTAVGDDATDTVTGQISDSDDSHHFGLSGPEFVVTKQANLPHVSAAGDVIIYTITVANTGGVELTNPSITDPLLGGALTTPDADTGTQGALDVGETWTFTQNYTVDQSVFDGAGVDADGNIDGDGDIDNIVTVDFDETDPQQAGAVVLLSSFCNGSSFFRLQNHPSTPGAGLTLAGFFAPGTPAQFNFNHALADVTMNVNDATISIDGIVYGGDPNDPARWQFEMSYDVEGQALDDDLFADVGTGTLTNLETNQVVQLTGKVGPDSFAFELGDGAGEDGLLGFDGITGWGWVMYNGSSYVPGSDGAFVAELLECSAVLDDGDASFSASGFQTVDTAGYGDDVAVATGYSGTATWTFEDLTAGATYRLSATWSPTGTAATDAPFTVSGIVGGDVTVEIDQTAAPSDFDEHGIAWEDLAEVRAAGTSLTVELSGTTSGDVIADAVRIERVQLVPDVEVRDEAGNIVNRSLDFGTVLEGELAERTITIENTGTATLDLGEVVLASDSQASLDVAGFSPSLEPGESTTFKVVLDTLAAGQYGATVMGLPFSFDASWTVNDTLIVDNRDPSPAFVQSGFTNYGSATFQQPQGYLGNIHYLRGSSPSGQAVWTFSGLPDGYYDVAATWPSHSNRATDSPFKLYVGADDGTPEAEQRLNQQLAPNDFNANGAAWERLGGLQITGGMLTVTLDNAVSNKFKYVIADAIRIQRTDPQQPEIEVLDGNGGSILGGIVVPNAEVDTAVTETITIQNLGPGQLNLGPITVSGYGQFSLDTTGTDLTLPAGRSTTFDVLLDTSVAGAFSATISIPSLAPQADANENPFVFTIDGTVVAPPPPTGDTKIIDNGDAGFSAPGFSGLGAGYVGALQGYQDDIHYHAPATGGMAAATWTFDNLTPGTYQVAATWNAHSSRAEDAPFTLAGTTNVGTVHLDQTQPPSSFAGAFSDAGASWAPLNLGGNGGNFTVSGTTLTVSLGTTPHGYVIADAVRIEKLQPLRAEHAAAERHNSSVPAALPASAVNASFDAAVAHWSAVDASAAARLSNVTVQIANLPGNVLGLASESTNRIWIDSNAAGYGWRLDQESRDQSQGPEGSIAITPSPLHPLTSSSFSLLTVVTHELGHVLGLPDLDESQHAHDVMAGRLDVGTRPLPLGIELATDTAAVRLRQAVGSAADHLFADLGNLFDEDDRDLWSDVSHRDRNELTSVVQLGPSAGSFPLEFDRVVDDGEELFADNSDRPTGLRDEESVDQLFAELFGKLG